MSVDIQILGDRELQRKLARLEDKAQKKIVQSALRKSAKRAKDRIIGNIQKLGLILTGQMLNAFKKMKIKSSSRKPRKLIRIGPEWPDRSELGISPDDKYFYPTAVEYGHGNVKAYPFVRPAIDEHTQAEHAKIAKDIGAGIIRESKK